MAKMKDAKILSTELLVDSFKKVVKERVQFTEDDVQDWIYLDTPKSIVVAAVTPEKQLVLVRLYRHNLRADFCELPAGGAEHDGETGPQAAKRELLEETGYTSEKLVDLGSYYVLPSETNRWVHFYLALDAIQVEQPKQDDLIEKYFDMSVQLTPFDEVTTPEGLKNAGIQGAESTFGIMLTKNYLEHL